MKPEEVAKALIKGMGKKAFIILPDLNSKLTWWMRRMLPGVVDMVMDADIKKVQKKNSPGA